MVSNINISDMLQMRTAAYRPPLAYRPNFSQVGLPPFTLWTVEWMRRDPQVRLGMSIKTSPLFRVKLTFQGDQVVADFMISQIRRFWQNAVPKITKALWYTISGGEIVYRENPESRRYEFASYNDIYPADLSILHVAGTGVPVGISVKYDAVSHTVNTYQQLIDNRYGQNGKPYSGVENLFFPKGFLYIHNREFGSLVGRSEFESAYDPWLEKNDVQGAKHSRKLWYYKNAFGGGILLHPPGNYQTPDGQDIPYHDIARQAMETSLNGAVWCLENKTDPAGNQLWQYIEPSVRQGGRELLDYVAHLDNEILRGLGIPDDVVQQVSGTGSYAGRSIPMMSFFIANEDVLDCLFSTCDEQVFRPLCIANFGHANYEATMDVDVESVMGIMGGNMQVQQPAMPVTPPQELTQLSHAQFIRQNEVHDIREGLPTLWDVTNPIYPSMRVIHIRPGDYGVGFDPISLSKADKSGRYRAEAGEEHRNKSGKISRGGQFTDKETSGTTASSSASDKTEAHYQEPKDYRTTGDYILQNPKLESHEFNRFIADKAGFRDRVLIGLSVVPNTSVYPNVLPGLLRLNDLANQGDRGAAQLLSDIAREHLSLLLSGIKSVRISSTPLTGMYEGVIESSLRSEVEFDPADRPKVLAAIARFATNFNQHQIHVRDDHLPTPSDKDETLPGHRYNDGSYNTAVYRISLTEPLDRRYIEDAMNAAGVYYVSASADDNDPFIEVYYVGPQDIPSAVRWQQSVRRLSQALGSRVKEIRRGTSRLWIYGHGDEAIPYTQIKGDYPIPSREATNRVARRIAERLAAWSVQPKLRKSLTEQQKKINERLLEDYDQMPDYSPSNPTIQKAYEALKSELKSQFQLLPVKVYTTRTQPYKSPAELRADVLENNTLKLQREKPSSTSRHPLDEESGFRDGTRTSEYPDGVPLTYRDLLKITHAYYGQTMPNRAKGELADELAWHYHMALTPSPWARWALTSELKGHRRQEKPKIGLIPIDYAKTGDPRLDQEIDGIREQIRDNYLTKTLPIQLSERLEEGRILINPKTGKKIKGGQFKPKGLTGTPVQPKVLPNAVSPRKQDLPTTGTVENPTPATDKSSNQPQTPSQIHQKPDKPAESVPPASSGKEETKDAVRGTASKQTVEKWQPVSTPRRLGDIQNFPRPERIVPRSSVMALYNPPPLEGNGESGKVTLWDVYSYFDKRLANKGRLGTDNHSAKLVGRAMAAEVLYGSQIGLFNLGWYDDLIKRSTALMATKYQELKTDPVKAGIFWATVAITSNGSTPNQNLEVASVLYDSYREHGRFNLDMSAWASLPVRGPAVRAAIQRLQELIDTKGEKGAVDFLNSQIPARDLNRLVSIRETADTMLYGSMIFGPKIGAFYQNLMGNFSPITMDRWFMRTANRIRGTSVSYSPSQGCKQAVRVLAMLGGDLKDIPEKHLKGHSHLKSLDRLKREGIPDSWLFDYKRSELMKDAESLLMNNGHPDDSPRLISWAIKVTAKLENDIRKRAVENQKRKKLGLDPLPLVKKPAAAQLADSIVDNYCRTNDAPKNARDREFLRRSVEEGQKVLRKYGIEISNAEFQANLWAYEKILTARFGIKSVGQEVGDYYTAARRLLKVT